MNIQLSNLCQFLPQVWKKDFIGIFFNFFIYKDKVVDFAKMNPLVDLFRATVKAVRFSYP